MVRAISPKLVIKRELSSSEQELTVLSRIPASLLVLPGFPHILRGLFSAKQWKRAETDGINPSLTHGKTGLNLTFPHILLLFPLSATMRIVRTSGSPFFGRMPPKPHPEEHVYSAQNGEN